MGTLTPMASEEPGRRERKKLATRRHIAVTAIALFLERGFDDVSVAEIAEAADVSKVTVFNHFPAKADMVFELADERRPQPAVVIRERPPGASAVEAVRDYYLQALDARAEWTGLHDGVGPFVKMVWGSPTLLGAFGARGHATDQELADALAEAVGETPTPIAPFGDPSDWGSGEPPGPLGHHLVAGLINGAITQLINANLARMLSGQTADQAAPAARADGRQAFAILGGGIGDYARRAT
jgi:AcrR family transcriptional regulator